jgi:hypothetical protein
MFVQRTTSGNLVSEEVVNQDNRLGPDSFIPRPISSTVLRTASSVRQDPPTEESNLRALPSFPVEGQYRAWSYRFAPKQKTDSPIPARSSNTKPHAHLASTMCRSQRGLPPIVRANCSATA